MSIARQVANFDPALFAADEISGDKVHGGTISGSPTLVTPALGTPASGTLTNATFPAGMPIKITEWNQSASYTNQSASFVTDGRGISITTTDKTAKIFIILRVEVHLKDINNGTTNHDSGPAGYCKLSYHSDSTTAGVAPSGPDISGELQTGMWINNDADLRSDLYTDVSMLAQATVSASTTYHIQVVSNRGADSDQNVTLNRRGYVMEIA